MKRGLTAINIGNYRGWGRSVAKSSDFHKALGALLASPNARSLTTGTDRRVYAMQWKARTYYVKLYTVRSLKARLQSLLGQNKAQKAWRCAGLLRQGGIATPQVVAHLQRVCWDGRREHILVSEGIAGQTLRKTMSETVAPARRRQLIKAMAEFLAKLHDGGIYHGDLTARNIMVEVDERFGLGWRVFIIDLDAIRSVRGVSPRRQVKNLDELGRNFHDLNKLSVHDRLRFLIQYTAARQSPEIPLRQLYAQVCDRTARRMRAVGLDFRSE